MARKQTDPPLKPIEQALAEANAQFFAERRNRSYVADMTDDQLRKLAREKLSEALQSVDPVGQPAMTQKLCSELMDRLDGKPMQMVHQTGDHAVQPTTINITYVSAPLTNGDMKMIEPKTIDH